MSRQKEKGTKFETEAARWLSERLGVEVRRNPLMASLDQGDLFGVFHEGRHFVIECKDHRLQVGAVYVSFVGQTVGISTA